MVSLPRQLAYYPNFLVRWGHASCLGRLSITFHSTNFSGSRFICKHYLAR
jgi:hypothetical protein